MALVRQEHGCSGWQAAYDAAAVAWARISLNVKRPSRTLRPPSLTGPNPTFVGKLQNRNGPAAQDAVLPPTDAHHHASLPDDDAYESSASEASRGTGAVPDRTDPV